MRIAYNGNVVLFPQTVYRPACEARIPINKKVDKAPSVDTPRKGIDRTLQYGTGLLQYRTEAAELVGDGNPPDVLGKQDVR